MSNKRTQHPGWMVVAHDGLVVAWYKYVPRKYHSPQAVLRRYENNPGLRSGLIADGYQVKAWDGASIVGQYVPDGAVSASA
ncbi:hypothetical protein [Mycobacteroides abscessus]